MKVLLIHEHGRSHGGGAVTALHRLHRGLLKAGVESVWACRKRALDEPEIVELPRSDRLEDFLGTFSWRLGLNDVHCVSSFKIKKFRPFLDADVVNIHGWHTNYFNYLALPGMAARKPVVGTMHDMWNITGHCSQSYECTRWKTGCGKCPHLDTFPPVGRDGTAWDFKLKSRAYGKSDVTFVAPSKWLLDMSRESMIRHHDLRQIPNPVDHELYKPMDRAELRRRLGLPPDKALIMFISVATKAWGKGGDLLVRALEGLPPRVKADSHLLIMGERGEEFAKACGIPATALGYIHEDEKKAPIYAAADVLVQPSRAENQSLVILESMSCGTPVVAFDVGGNAEITLKGPGGIIVPPEDAAQMSEAIARIIEDGSLARTLREGARASVVENYSLDLHVQRYISLFREKIEQREGRSAKPA